MKVSECEAKIRKILHTVEKEYSDLPLGFCRDVLVERIASFIHSEFGLEKD